MRVFVYSKKTSKMIARINDIVSVVDEKDSESITFITDSGEFFTFDKKQVKTTSYQN